MKKILLILLLAIGLQAEVNECVSDVYFGNGINTSEQDADDSIQAIQKQFKLKYPKKYEFVNDWKVSYNHSYGIGVDLYESMMQKIFEDFKKGGLAPFVWYVLDLTDYSVKGL